MCAAMDVVNNNQIPNNAIIEKLKSGDSGKLAEILAKPTANISQEGPSKPVVHHERVKQPSPNSEPCQLAHQSSSGKSAPEVKKLSKKARMDLEIKNLKLRNRQLRKQCDDCLKQIHYDTVINIALETGDYEPLNILRDEIRKNRDKTPEASSHFDRGIRDGVAVHLGFGVRTSGSPGRRVDPGFGAQTSSSLGLRAPDFECLRAHLASEPLSSGSPGLRVYLAFRAQTSFTWPSSPGLRSVFELTWPSGLPGLRVDLRFGAQTSVHLAFEPRTSKCLRAHLAFRARPSSSPGLRVYLAFRAAFSAIPLNMLS
uniref:BZIP domain-containing protein n=1 Tax=Panagrellus redivivus TaxID=6233 RepID=A0A7E4WDY9_PANRE